MKTLVDCYRSSKLFLILDSIRKLEPICVIMIMEFSFATTVLLAESIYGAEFECVKFSRPNRPFS